MNNPLINELFDDINVEESELKYSTEGSDQTNEEEDLLPQDNVTNNDATLDNNEEDLLLSIKI